MGRIEYITNEGAPYVYLADIPKLDIFKTFDCGQCFRFDPVSLYGNKYEFGGVAYGKYVVFAQNSPYELKIYGTTPEEYESLWRHYLALDTDYEAINSSIISATKSAHMEKAVLYGDGIRILRQEPWECVCSFIISQNNNIPRIKKLVAALCNATGKGVNLAEKMEGHIPENHREIAGNFSPFPTPEEVLKLGVEGLRELKMGFRAKYIFDAAEKVSKGEISLDFIRGTDDLNVAVNNLCKIQGVGPKVAACTLLFGFNKLAAFPVDVWIKRVIEKYFDSDFSPEDLGEFAGVAQQYLFYYERYLGGDK